MKPDHTLADYGCGTLRIGVHAMKCLEPGGAIGSEISQEFLDQGRELAALAPGGERPHLRRSRRIVAESVAARRVMVISTKVFNHAIQIRISPNNFKR